MATSTVMPLPLKSEKAFCQLFREEQLVFRLFSGCFIETVITLKSSGEWQEQPFPAAFQYIVVISIRPGSKHYPSCSSELIY